MLRQSLRGPMSRLVGPHVSRLIGPHVSRLIGPHVSRLIGPHVSRLMGASSQLYTQNELGIVDVERKQQNTLDLLKNILYVKTHTVVILLTFCRPPVVKGARRCGYHGVHL